MARRRLRHDLLGKSGTGELSAIYFGGKGDVLRIKLAALETAASQPPTETIKVRAQTAIDKFIDRKLDSVPKGIGQDTLADFVSRGWLAGLFREHASEARSAGPESCPPIGLEDAECARSTHYTAEIRELRHCFIAADRGGGTLHTSEHDNFHWSGT